MTSKWWRWLALLAVLTVVTAACGDDDDDEATSGTDGGASTTAAATSDTTGGSAAGLPLRGVTDTSITVGGLSQLQNYGGINEGVEARFARANAEGGVNGRTIDFIGVQDDASDSTQNLSLTRQLVESDNVFAVLPVASANFLPQSSDYLIDQQTAFLGWGFMPGFCGNDYGFGFTGCLIGGSLGLDVPTGSSVVDSVIPLAGGTGADATGLTLGIISGDDDAGRAGNDQYVALWEERGGTVTYKEAAIPVGGANDYSPFIADLSTSNDGDWPDVIFVSTDFPSAAGMHGALRAAGYPGIAMNFAAYVPGLLQSSPDLAAAFEGSYAWTTIPPQEGGGAAVDQILSDLTANGSDPVQGLGTAIGWYIADIFLQMLEHAGPDLGGSMQGFVDSINAGFTYSPPAGGLGPLEFPRDHTDGVPCAAVLRVVNAEYEVATPFTCFENLNL